MSVAILDQPLIYMPILGVWFLFELYYIVSSSENDIKESDILGNGVSSVYTAIMISPLVYGGGDFSLSAFADPSPRTLLSIGLFVYSGFMIVAAFTKILPKFIVDILGGASLDTFLTVLALFYVDAIVPVDFPLIVAMLIPVIILQVLKFIRGMTKHHF